MSVSTLAEPKAISLTNSTGNFPHEVQQMEPFSTLKTNKKNPTKNYWSLHYRILFLV